MDSSQNQTSSSSQGVSSTQTSHDEDNTPLWRYVTKIEKTGEGGGNWKWICNFCGEQKQGTYTRVKGHLLKLSGKGIGTCKKVKIDDLSEMRKADEEATTRSLNSQPKRVPLPVISTIMGPSSTNQSSSLEALKRRRIQESDLVKSFDMQHRDQLDAEIARMFYTGGLPFNFAKNPYFVSSYAFAANHSLGGYVPPGYNKLRTTLLLQEKIHVERLLEPIKSTWGEKGVSIVSDGWSDP
ncbi:uncharacterized protein LOC126688364 [Mercurialis annua]|uniref:uncharacterized protein LOC126688364 n=1 Tax=Mercurialis annua TaxID=3986 RepID=UPI00215EBA20|nr:uncharacterized protein LOC126688364 [Mercurialis annua]